MQRYLIIDIAGQEIEYVVFTPDEAGSPELHEGPWHFEPVTDYEGCGEVYSQGYETAEEAEAAARQDAEEQWLNQRIANGEAD